MICRSGEEPKTHFRTDRFYRSDGQWFFTTREKIEVGPFSSREEADKELILYLSHVNEGCFLRDMVAATTKQGKTSEPVVH